MKIHQMILIILEERVEKNKFIIEKYFRFFLWKYWIEKSNQKLIFNTDNIFLDFKQM